MSYISDDHQQCTVTPSSIHVDGVCNNTSQSNGNPLYIPGKITFDTVSESTAPKLPPLEDDEHQMNVNLAPRFKSALAASIFQSRVGQSVPQHGTSNAVVSVDSSAEVLTVRAAEIESPSHAPIRVSDILQMPTLEGLDRRHVRGIFTLPIRKGYDGHLLF
jgi:hypothetical protein